MFRFQDSGNLKSTCDDLEMGNVLKPSDKPRITTFPSTHVQSIVIRVGGMHFAEELGLLMGKSPLE
jgi:hypothetical protein